MTYGQKEELPEEALASSYHDVPSYIAPEKQSQMQSASR
jgi:hypothetical protein